MNKYVLFMLNRVSIQSLLLLVLEIFAYIPDDEKICIFLVLVCKIKLNFGCEKVPSLSKKNMKIKIEMLL